MKKKTWIIVFIEIATIVTLLVIRFAPDNTQKIAIATLMFGTNICTNHEGRELRGGLALPPGGSPAFCKFECVICHKQAEESSISGYGPYKLCRSCADLTNRCRFCGRLGY